MNTLRHWLVRLSGHDIAHAEGVRDEDTGGLTKIGAAIAVAAIVACANAGVAAWEFSQGLGPSGRLTLALLAGVFGALLVLVIDRAAVYFSDTALHTGRWAVGLYVTMRVVMILCLGSFTSQAVMPVLLGPELKAHALQLRETSEDSRDAALQRRFGTAERLQRMRESAGQVERLEKTQAQLPSEITRHLAVARACWSSHAAERQALLARGLSGHEISEQLAPKAQSCRAQTQAADIERDRHLAASRRAVEAARADHAAATQDLASARASIDERMKTASEVEREATTEHSADVLASLVAKNPGARVKWMLLTLLQVTLELLPLMLKFNAGQSPLGHRIAVERDMTADALARRQSDQRYLHARMAACQTLDLMAARALASSPRARALADGRHLDVLERSAALRSASEVLDGMRWDQDRINEQLRDHPRHASTVMNIWGDAMDRTARRLRGVQGADDELADTDADEKKPTLH